MCCLIFNKKKIPTGFFLVSLAFFFVISLPTNVLSISKAKIKNITINGRVKESNRELLFPEGLDVVLLKFVLNHEGEVTPLGPQGRVKTKKNGEYKFVNVVPDLKAGYQLGTRLEGELHSSKIFFMREKEHTIEKNIVIPEISNAIEKLKTSQMSIVIESGLGNILVTEVVIFTNSYKQRIDTKSNPIKIKLPQEMQNFRFLRSTSKKTIEHKIKDNVLKIKYIFPPGDSQIIYQYNLTAWFGTLEMKREFDHSLEIIGILTPIDRLQIKSNKLIFSGKQNFDKTTFLTWKIRNSDSNQINFEINNVPQTSLQYLVVSIVIILLLFYIVLLFFRKRLHKKIKNE